MALELVLNNLVDTISTILLVFEESNRNINTKMRVNPTGPLSKAAENLVSLAEKVQASFELEEAKQKMGVLIDEMKKNTALLASYSEKMLDREDNQKILLIIKDVMNGAVKMLKLQDEMKVKTVILAGKRTTDSVRRVVKVETLGQLQEAGSDMSTNLVNLAQQFNKR